MFVHTSLTVSKNEIQVEGRSSKRARATEYKIEIKTSLKKDGNEPANVAQTARELELTNVSILFCWTLIKLTFECSSWPLEWRHTNRFVASVSLIGMHLSFMSAQQGTKIRLKSFKALSSLKKFAWKHRKAFVTRLADLNWSNYHLFRTSTERNWNHRQITVTSCLIALQICLNNTSRNKHKGSFTASLNWSINCNFTNYG